MIGYFIDVFIIMRFDYREFINSLRLPDKVLLWGSKRM